MAENESSLEAEAALLREQAQKHRQDAETTVAYLDANRSTMSGEAIEEFTGAALLDEARADECDRLAAVLQTAADLVASNEVAIAEARAAGKADGLGEGWENGRLDCIACCRAEIREIEKWMARPSQDGHCILRKLRDLRPVAESKKHEVADA